MVFFPHGKNVSADKLILSTIRIERVKVPHTKNLPRYFSSYKKEKLPKIRISGLILLVFAQSILKDIQ